MKKLKDLKQTDGRADKPRAMTLDQIWGHDSTSRYKTSDVGEYEAYIKELPLTDLRKHALGVGLVPIDDRNRLITRLVREFKAHIGKLKRPRFPGVEPKKVSKETLATLAQGR